MKEKIIVNCSYRSLVVARISTDVFTNNLHGTHFSFAAWCNPLEFANILEDLISNRDDSEKYRNTDYCTLGEDFDKIYFTRNCASVSINRGGIDTLFHGCIDVLRNLPDKIRKEYDKYDKKIAKELQEDM